MKEYVLGFLFSGSDFLAVNKTHGPAEIVGRWNGVGGELEEGEELLAAMIREFHEEIGVEITNWKFMGCTSGPGFKVHLFSSRIPLPFSHHNLNDANEEIRWIPSSSSRREEEGLLSAPDLDWIIPACQCGVVVFGNR